MQQGSSDCGYQPCRAGGPVRYRSVLDDRPLGKTRNLLGVWHRLHFRPTDSVCRCGTGLKHYASSGNQSFDYTRKSARRPFFPQNCQLVNEPAEIWGRTRSLAIHGVDSHTYQVTAPGSDRYAQRVFPITSESAMRPPRKTNWQRCSNNARPRARSVQQVDMPIKRATAFICLQSKYCLWEPNVCWS